MDFTVAARKLLCEQLKEAKETSSSSSTAFRGIPFQRAWLQGVLTSVSIPDNNSHFFILDDGTAFVHLLLDNTAFLNLKQWQIGMYVMVVGAHIPQDDETPLVKVHKIVDLSSFPNREAMWYLEVIEASKMFYHN